MSQGKFILTSQAFNSKTVFIRAKWGHKHSVQNSRIYCPFCNLYTEATFFHCHWSRMQSHHVKWISGRFKRKKWPVTCCITDWWNSLPQDGDMATSLGGFKRLNRLKSWWQPNEGSMFRGSILMNSRCWDDRTGQSCCLHVLLIDVLGHLADCGWTMDARLDGPLVWSNMILVMSVLYDQVLILSGCQNCF